MGLTRKRKANAASKAAAAASAAVSLVEEGKPERVGQDDEEEVEELTPTKKVSLGDYQ